MQAAGQAASSVVQLTADAGVAAALTQALLVLGEEPDFVFWKDRGSVFLGCNQKFAEVAGFKSPSEIIGKTDYDLAWSDSEADYFREVDRRVIETRSSEFHTVEPRL